MNRTKPTRPQGAALEIGAPELTCYRLWDTSPELRPARPPLRRPGKGLDS